MALEWLHQHNSLCKDVVIDYAQLDQWKSEFIPTRILDNIVQCDDTHHEKEGYTANLGEDNHELHREETPMGFVQSLDGYHIIEKNLETTESSTTKSSFAVNSRTNTPTTDQSFSDGPDLTQLTLKPPVLLDTTISDILHSLPGLGPYR